MENFINKIFNEDVLDVLRRMSDDSVDMIYGDPDYNVGINYAGKKFTAKWDEYIDWYIELTRECMRVLKPKGNLFMINYPRQNAYLRVNFLDKNAFAVNDYVWVYNSNIGHSNKKFTTAHRVILHATKSKDNNFYKNQVALPYQNLKDRRIRERIQKGSVGRMPYSWFYFDLVKNVSKDKTFHSCQIPLGLFEMLIKASTRIGDSVFILFGGSGSEIMKCNGLERDFISCEIHPKYYKMILDRVENGGEISPEYRLDFLKTKMHLESISSSRTKTLDFS